MAVHFSPSQAFFPQSCPPCRSNIRLKFNINTFTVSAVVRNARHEQQPIDHEIHQSLTAWDDKPESVPHDELRSYRGCYSVI